MKTMDHPEWTEHFDFESCLWTSPFYGHTVSSESIHRPHSGPDTASMLVIVAQLDGFDAFPVDVADILKALEALQIQDPQSKHYGCFRWYAEVDTVEDTNAAFFITLNLLVLALGYRERLSLQCNEIIDSMLRRADAWFDSALRRPAATYYPNKWLGDLVCSWLLKEVLDETEGRAHTLSLMKDLIEDWRVEPFGWGEHLSDFYASICMDELSLLLLGSRQLPSALRLEFIEMLNRLLSIEDAFGDRPRLPAIRSYAFDHMPKRFHYRGTIRKWKEFGSIESFTYQYIIARPTLGKFFCENGWHDLVAPEQPPSSKISVPCMHDTWARSHRNEHWSWGALSRFPLMAEMEKISSGLSWQSFPVAVWRQDAWGYLQWRVLEGETQRTLPAHSLKACKNNPQLSDRLETPIVPTTQSEVNDQGILAQRHLPEVLERWDSICDQFVLQGPWIKSVHVSTATCGDEQRWLIENGNTKIELCARCVSHPQSIAYSWHQQDDTLRCVASLENHSFRGGDASSFSMSWQIKTETKVTRAFRPRSK